MDIMAEHLDKTEVTSDLPKFDFGKVYREAFDRMGISSMPGMKYSMALPRAVGRTFAHEMTKQLAKKIKDEIAEAG